MKWLFGGAVVGLIAASLAVHSMWLFVAALGVGFIGALNEVWDSLRRVVAGG